jgi:flagellar M-ring protein FliF
VNSLLETLKKLGPARISVLGAVLLGLLMFFVFVSMRVSSPDMKMLYTDLNTDDASSVAARLEELKIRYQISPDGTRVMVPAADVGRSRMLLAQDGLPNGGSLGYEIFDKQSNFGTTNFVQNINQVRALEGELARTIGALAPVKSARVHLVLPQRELFSRESRAASASVFITLRGGAQLDRSQIQGIQSLIASAVPDLKSKNVSIVDSDGNLLAQGGEDDNSLLSSKAEEMRRNYEQRLTRAVEDMIGRTVGYGKVRATVNADLNFDRVSQNEELFNPEGQVARSIQTVEENASERGGSGENISVQNNLPGAGADTLGDGGPTSNSNRVEETTNFEISKTTRNSISESGGVKRLSVAVLIDGTYTTDAEGAKTYQPRSEAELDRISALVRSAVGFDASRGDTLEVVNMQFAEINTEADEDLTRIMGFERADLLDAAEVITVAIMIILVVLLVLQPMVGRLLATEGPKLDDADALNSGLLPGMMQNPQLAGPNMGGGFGEGSSSEEYQPPQLADEPENNLIDVQKVEGRVKASSLKKVEDIVTAYPEETVSVLRNWMTQES